MDAEPEPLDLTETIVAVALLMREAEGASDRTLENIFKQAARRGGRQTFHRGKLGRYKYYRDSNSFALVQPSDAEARADLRASDRSIERIIKKLVSYDRGTSGTNLPGVANLPGGTGTSRTPWRRPGDGGLPPVPAG